MNTACEPGTIHGGITLPWRSFLLGALAVATYLVLGAAPEAWAYGLRNPWRFSFDRNTGDLWVGDVGQLTREEIDLVRAGDNMGWDRREGFIQHEGNDPATSFKSPVIDYPRTSGNVVVGGYVYRGSTLGMDGHYFYGDFLDGYVRSALIEADVVRFQQDWTQALGTQAGLASFGVDGHGELYLLNLFSGTVQKLIRDN